MATFTVSIPEEIKKEMDKHPEINWAEYLKQRFEIRLKELEKFEALKNQGFLGVPKTKKFSSKLKNSGKI